MEAKDLLLTPEQIYQAGQNYFEGIKGVNHSQYTHNQASLKTARAIRYYMQDKFDNTGSPDIQFALSYILVDLDSIIKEIETGSI
jgi:hypothetical protein